ALRVHEILVVAGGGVGNGDEAIADFAVADQKAAGLARERLPRGPNQVVEDAAVDEHGADLAHGDHSGSVKIFPGFMMLCGSSARLIRRMASRVAGLNASGRKSDFMMPMPCSPEIVPPSWTAS